MFHDFVHFPKFFQSVELLNVWNNCVATVELNCGVTVEQKSAKNSFFSSTLWKSKFHYVEQLWNCLFHTVEQSLDQSTRNSTLWNFWLERHKVQFHTMEQNLRFQVRGCHMQLFSGRRWLPRNHNIYADRRWDFSQLDLKDRIL